MTTVWTGDERMDERCASCGGVLAGMYEGPLCRVCEFECPADEDDCAECERSEGPHYTGPCVHGGVR